MVLETDGGLNKICLPVPWNGVVKVTSKVVLKDYMGRIIWVSSLKYKSKIGYRRWATRLLFLIFFCIMAIFDLT